MRFCGITQWWDTEILRLSAMGLPPMAPIPLLPNPKSMVGLGGTGTRESGDIAG